ncbi:MAG: hypothetical protein HOY69_35165 [Streptomyces sp.]|nr:hypothetical protein [Streptomyces sp.]
MTAFGIGELVGQAGAVVGLVLVGVWVLSYPWRVPQSLVHQPEQLAEVSRQRNRTVRRVTVTVAALWLLTAVATGIWVQVR